MKKDNWPLKVLLYTLLLLFLLDKLDLYSFMGIYKYKTIDIQLNSAHFDSLQNINFILDLSQEIFSKSQGDQEHSLLLVTDTSYVLKGYKLLHSGSIDHAEIDLSILYRNLVLLGGTGYIFIHNHPGSSVYPSSLDDSLTMSFIESAEIFGVRFLDHIIIDEKDNYYSYFQSGRLQKIRALTKYNISAILNMGVENE